MATGFGSLRSQVVPKGPGRVGKPLAALPGSLSSQQTGSATRRNTTWPQPTVGYAVGQRGDERLGAVISSVSIGTHEKSSFCGCGGDLSSRGMDDEQFPAHQQACPTELDGEADLLPFRFAAGRVPSFGPGRGSAERAGSASVRRGRGAGAALGGGASFFPYSSRQPPPASLGGTLLLGVLQRLLHGPLHPRSDASVFGSPWASTKSARSPSGSAASRCPACCHAVRNASSASRTVP